MPPTDLGRPHAARSWTEQGWKVAFCQGRAESERVARKTPNNRDGSTHKTAGSVWRVVSDCLAQDGGREGEEQMDGTGWSSSRMVKSNGALSLVQRYSAVPGNRASQTSEPPLRAIWYGTQLARYLAYGREQQTVSGADRGLCAGRFRADDARRDRSAAYLANAPRLPRHVPSYT